MPEKQVEEAQQASILQPEGWLRPRGYANGIAASGRLIFISGQVGWDERGRFVSDGFVAQARQTLRNILTILAEAGGTAGHITRLTWYILDKQEYLACQKELG